MIVWAYSCWRDGEGFGITSLSLTFGVADLCGCLYCGGFRDVGRNTCSGILPPQWGSVSDQGLTAKERREEREFQLQMARLKIEVQQEESRAEREAKQAEAERAAKQIEAES
ncbi:hypothetical protein NDU88_001829 [Pleurodeles waltl]|uniref:Uncharacterized protein n=1 Tax=Pleurodeles waltl TaxID=8319 RepID=A0AAV7RDQ0_PLEWA|nr:hypothetical protein NDU88_001829 [Pleurodeles waltl]